MSPCGVCSPQLVLSPARLFMEILNSCTDCDEIQFMEDGSWCPMKPKKENQEVCQTSAFSGTEGMGALVTNSGFGCLFLPKQCLHLQFLHLQSNIWSVSDPIWEPVFGITLKYQEHDRHLANHCGVSATKSTKNAGSS